MQIKERIDSIISSRKEKAEKLKAKKESIGELRKALREISALEAQKDEIMSEDIKSEFILKFKGLELKECIEQVNDLFRDYNSVIDRLSKDYISIATIGKERQGKSQFLQSVSRLDNRVIPAYDGTSCTGATSIIINDDSYKEGELKAIISFKSKDYLVELVRGYISVIDPQYPIEEIVFDQIDNLRMDDLEAAAGTDAKKVTAFEHISKIYEHYDEISGFFSKEPEVYTDPEKIKRVVAQNNGLSEDKEGYEAYYTYLAVDKAKIYCRFYYDAGKIRLIDTIGIETTQSGAEQAMLDTVKNESDAAIVVTMPISTTQEKDIELNNNLVSHFSDKAPEKWLFYLVNHYKGRNDNTVVGFDRSISKFAIAGHMIVDCSDEEDVNNRFMVDLLEKLTDNIDSIDQIYLDQLEAKAMALRVRIRKLINYIDNLSANRRSGIVALKKGRECYNDIGADLRKIVEHYYHELNEPYGILFNEIKRILDKLDSEITPSAEMIQEIADRNAILPGEVWINMLHYVRNEITKRFVAIDDVLAIENIRFKNKLVKVFYNNMSELFGEYDTVDDDSIDMTKELRNRMEGIIADSKKYSQIRDAIVFLDNFSFNTRAAIIQIVRSHMGIINPLSEEYASPQINFHHNNCGKEINYYLTSRLSLIEENLRHALIGIYNTPNQAFYAVAEEFYDKMTFAATDISSGRIISMSDVWSEFFQDYYDMIWRDDAKQSELLNKLMNNIKLLKPLLVSCIETEEE